MPHSDEIREYLKVQFNQPGRNRGDCTVTIKAGEVARELNAHISYVRPAGSGARGHRFRGDQGQDSGQVLDVAR